MTSKAVAPGQHGTASQAYVYSKLSDLTVQSSRVNVWGVVKFFKEPQRSRGTDYFQMFSIVDDSLDPKDQSAKLVCILFNADLKSFPSIRQVGDVVRLHRANIKPYQSNHSFGGPAHSISSLQAVSSYGFSWVVVDGDLSTEVKPRSNAQEFTFSDTDKARADELRRWFVKNHAPSNVFSLMQSGNADQARSSGQSATVVDPQVASTGTSASSSAAPFGVKWIDSVSLNSYFDAAALVVGIGVKSSDRCVLFVTDGSMTNQNTRTLPPFAAVDPAELPVLRIDDELYNRFSNWLVPVIVFDDHCAAVEQLHPGDYVHIRNLHCTSAKTSSLASISLLENRAPSLPCVEIVLHGKTHFGRGLRKLPPDDGLAQRLSERINALQKAAAEQEEAANTSMAIRAELGPFADLLHRQSRYHTRSSANNSPTKSPNKGQTQAQPTGARLVENEDGFEEMDDDDDDGGEWEVVRMRDVATQTNLP